MKSEVMRALAAAGATIEMIAAAVEAEQIIEEQKLSEKRAKAAERQRNKRKRDAVSRDVTVTERDSALHDVTACDETLSPPSSPKKVSPSKPLQKITPPTSSIPSARRLADDWPEDFGDLFWKAYPRKTEKLSAMRKLATIRKSAIVTWQDLLAGVHRYAAATINTDQKYVKQPPAWLNAGCWADEIKLGGSNGERDGNTRTTGHDAILAVANRKARELDRNDDMARSADATGFAFGNGSDGSGSGGNSDAIGSDQRDHHRGEPDRQRIREGEIIPPDKNAAGVPRSGEFI